MQFNGSYTKNTYSSIPISLKCEKKPDPAKKTIPIENPMTGLRDIFIRDNENYLYFELNNSGARQENFSIPLWKNGAEWMVQNGSLSRVSLVIYDGILDQDNGFG